MRLQDRKTIIAQRRLPEYGFEVGDETMSPSGFGRIIEVTGVQVKVMVYRKEGTCGYHGSTFTKAQIRAAQ